MSCRCRSLTWSKCLSRASSPIASAVRYKSFICSSLALAASGMPRARPPDAGASGSGAVAGGSTEPVTLAGGGVSRPGRFEETARFGHRGRTRQRGRPRQDCHRRPNCRRRPDCRPWQDHWQRVRGLGVLIAFDRGQSHRRGGQGFRARRREGLLTVVAGLGRGLAVGRPHGGGRRVARLAVAAGARGGPPGGRRRRAQAICGRLARRRRVVLLQPVVTVAAVIAVLAPARPCLGRTVPVRSRCRVWPASGFGPPAVGIVPAGGFDPPAIRLRPAASLAAPGIGLRPAGGFDPPAIRLRPDGAVLRPVRTGPAPAIAVAAGVLLLMISDLVIGRPLLPSPGIRGRIAGRRPRPRTRRIGLAVAARRLGPRGPVWLPVTARPRVRARTAGIGPGPRPPVLASGGVPALLRPIVIGRTGTLRPALVTLLTRRPLLRRWSGLLIAGRQALLARIVLLTRIVLLARIVRLTGVRASLLIARVRSRRRLSRPAAVHRPAIPEPFIRLLLALRPGSLGGSGIPVCGCQVLRPHRPELAEPLLRGGLPVDLRHRACRRTYGRTSLLPPLPHKQPDHRQP